jgi:hypothetical protein
MDANQQRQTSSGAKPLSPTRLETGDNPHACRLLVDGFTTVLAASFAVSIGGMTRSTLFQCYTPTRLETDLTLKIRQWL